MDKTNALFTATATASGGRNGRTESDDGLVKAELFPMQVRALGVGMPYAIANAIFGGTAEAVALWFKHENLESSFYWYVSAMAAVALLSALAIPRMSNSVAVGIADDLRS